MAARLAALGVRFDGVAGPVPMTRARETAAILAEALPYLTPRLDPDLWRSGTPPTWRPGRMARTA